MSYISNLKLSQKFMGSLIILGVLPLIIISLVGVTFILYSSDEAGNVTQDILISNQEEDLLNYVKAQSTIIEDKFSNYATRLRTMSPYVEELITTTIIDSKWNESFISTYMGGSRGFSTDNNMGDLFIPDFISLNSTVNDTIAATSTMRTMFNSLLKEDPTLLAAYIGTPQHITRYYPYVNLTSLIPSDWSIIERPWYKTASTLPKNSVSWTMYIDAVSSELIATVATPVFNNSKLFGVIGFDISLSSIQNLISDIRYKETGYSILLNENLEVIAKPDIQNTSVRFDEVVGLNDLNLLNLTNINLLNKFENSITTDSGSFSATISSNSDLNTLKTKVWVYQKLFTSNWLIYVSVERNELISVAETVQDLILNTAYDYMVVSIIFLVFIVFLTIIAGFQISRMITKPIKNLTQVTQTLEDGRIDLSIIEDSNRKDELGILQSNYYLMLKDLNSFIQATNKSADQVSKSSILVSEVAKETTSLTDEIASAVQEITKSANVQSGYASRTIEELDGMDKTVDTSIQNIESTISIIEDIAEQTNILALNAAIEAARAGEYGRGFAVVADNVRRLADETKTNSSDINQLTQTILTSIKNSVSNLRETLEGFATQSEEFSASSEEVAAATQEQIITMKGLSQSATELATLSEKMVHQLDKYGVR